MISVVNVRKISVAFLSPDVMKKSVSVCKVWVYSSFAKLFVHSQCDFLCCLCDCDAVLTPRSRIFGDGLL